WEAMDLRRDHRRSPLLLGQHPHGAHYGASTGSAVSVAWRWQVGQNVVSSLRQLAGGVLPGRASRGGGATRADQGSAATTRDYDLWRGHFTCGAATIGPHARGPSMRRVVPATLVLLSFIYL